MSRVNTKVSKLHPQLRSWMSFNTELLWIVSTEQIRNAGATIDHFNVRFGAAVKCSVRMHAMTSLNVEIMRVFPEILAVGVEMLWRNALQDPES